MNPLAKWLGPTSVVALSALATAQNVSVDTYRLANGMTVILHEDHTVPLATVNIWYRVGSKDEPPKHSGFAHLFEHLMFMGTKRVPTGQYDQIMEGGGGENNASTAEDRTNFYDSGPSNLVPTLLWLEADRLQDLGKSMTQKKLNLQRDVVKNERRQNTENTPYGTAYEAVNGLMFPPGHPYHTSVIGSMTDLDNASVQDVQAFFSRYYVPNNASLVVAGDFDQAATKALIDKYFGTLPRKPDVPRKPVPPLTPLGVKEVMFKDKVQVPKIIETWHSPAAYQPGDAEIQLAASVLADGVNSRLYQRLVVRDKLATAINAFQEERLLGSVFYIDATAAKGADLKKLRKAIDEELLRFTNLGPTKDELLRQSAKIESGTLNGLQSMGNVADSLNTYEFYLGRPNAFKEVLDRFRKATPADVQRVAKKTFTLGNRVIITVLPDKVPSPAPVQKTSGGAAERLVTHRRDPRDVRPSIGKPKGFDAPAPLSFKLANGIPVYYWKRSALPLMSLDLILRTGADADPAENAGLSALTADLLTQGAGTRNTQQFQDALDLLGADLGASAGHRTIGVGLNVLARNFDPAVKLCADAVQRPSLSEKDFERIKQVTIANLEQERDDVGTTASLVASREFFGWSNPAGRPVSGTPKTVGGLRLDQVKSEHLLEYRPDVAAFYVAGSLDLASVKSSLNRAFGSWGLRIGSGGAPALVKSSSPGAPSDGLRIFVVDKPGAVQTAIRFLMPAPSYSSPDRLKLRELGTLLGGTFTSRLNQNLREDKGYTYGAFGGFAFDRNFGSFYATASVRADVTGASLKEFLKEFDRIRKGDISAQEVAKATATIRAEEVSSLSSLSGLLGDATSLAAFGRPITGLNEDEKALLTIQAAQLNQLAKTAIPYEKGILVLVGAKAQILKQLTGLSLPTPQEVSAD
jgi:predicted Zn-dependent peptidase